MYLFLKTERAYETHQINLQWCARLFDLFEQMSGVRIKMDPRSSSCAHLLSLLFKTYCNCAFKQQAFTASTCIPLMAKLWNSFLLCHATRSVICSLRHVLHLSALPSPSPSSVFWLFFYLRHQQCVVDILHVNSVQNMFSHSCSSSDSYIPFIFYKTIET